MSIARRIERRSQFDNRREGIVRTMGHAMHICRYVHLFGEALTDYLARLDNGHKHSLNLLPFPRRSWICNGRQRDVFSLWIKRLTLAKLSIGGTNAVLSAC